MKIKALFPICALALTCAIGCQSTDSAGRSTEASDAMAMGHACSQCECKAYSPGRLIKGVCTTCGHTAAEHSGPAK